MQPMDLPQFNCEFVLYARQGHPTFVETRAFPMWFQAPRGAIVPSPRSFSRTLKVRGGIISQANRYLGSCCSSQRIFPPQIIQVLLFMTSCTG